MSERIRELENALEASHYSSGNDLGPHPLLCNDLRAIRFVVGHTIESEDQIPRHKIDPLDSFGALKICDGETRFLGPSAGSEVRIWQKIKQIRSSTSFAGNTASASILDSFLISHDLIFRTF